MVYSYTNDICRSKVSHRCVTSVASFSTTWVGIVVQKVGKVLLELLRRWSQLRSIVIAVPTNKAVTIVGTKRSVLNEFFAASIQREPVIIVINPRRWWFRYRRSERRKVGIIHRYNIVQISQDGSEGGLYAITPILGKWRHYFSSNSCTSTYPVP